MTIATGQDAAATDLTGSRSRILQPAQAMPWNPDRYALTINGLKGSMAGSNIFTIPIDLPDGCVLNNILLNCYKDNAGSDFDVAVYRVAKAGTASYIVNQFVVPATGAQEIDVDCADEVINNAAYSYVLYMLITPAVSINTAEFISAVVNYTITHPKP